MEYVCQVCMEMVDSENKGTECADGHFLCDECLNPYLTQNVFPNLHTLKRNHFCVTCPVADCSCVYNSVLLYKKMHPQERTRYSGIIGSLSSVKPQVAALSTAFQEVLTLKCPTCRNPVDPNPDACSAIKCLNCGNWYCNCCFLGFSSGNGVSDETDDRAAAHAHAASHHPREDHQDAFLPREVVAAGQLQLQRRLLVECLVAAITPPESGENGRLDASLGLFLVSGDLDDLQLSSEEVWTDAEALVTRGLLVPTPLSHIAPAPSLVASDGSVQLVSALKTQNLIACQQVMHAFKDSLNCNYVDEEDGIPVVSIALYFRYKSIVVLLLRRGADPLMRSRDGFSVLYKAIESGMLDVVKLIYELNPTLGVNIPIGGAYEYHPLHVAAKFNHGHIVKFLCSKDADVHRKEIEWDYTPLSMAVVLQHRWASRELLLQGSSVNVRGRQGRTPLHVLAEKGEVDLLTMVLSDTSIDVNAPVDFREGQRLLHVAATYGQAHVLSYLVSLGSRVDLNCRDDKFGLSALGFAVFFKKISCCRILLRAGACAIQPDNSGRAPMFNAIEKAPEVVKDLVLIGHVDINAGATLQPVDALPLTLSIIYKQCHLISTLIDELGANVNQAEAITSTTALYQAVLQGDNYAALLLLERGANASQPCGHGRTPMHAAIEAGSTSLIRLLVEKYRVDVNAEITAEDGGRCALHAAALLDSANATNELLLLGGNILQVDGQGRTPIDIANDKPTSPVLHMLLEHQCVMDTDVEQPSGGLLQQIFNTFGI